MISKAKLKLVRSLEQKKYRKQEGLFVAEGPKVVGDLLQVMPAQEVFATREWLEQHASVYPTLSITEINEEELHKLSFLQHPQQIVGIFPIRKTAAPTEWTGELSLALDGVQDPGNLGTIIRIADWFGIETIYCSVDTADVYNPKVVQATMGSIARVNIIYTSLAALIDSLPAGTPICGTLLDGENIYEQPLPQQGLIIMGNEGKGISPEIASRVNRRLLIPNYPQNRATADSLNVAIATAITCAEFRRQAK
ncbi:MAG: RNA methyltransferase [Prevotella sp.]|nr:RNA methyltransferase [Prevotella sp.]